MKYKSRFGAALMLQDKLIRDKEREIAGVAAGRLKAQAELAREEEKISFLWKSFETGGAVDSASFINGFDHGAVRELKTRLEKWDANLKERRAEYQSLLKKRDIISDMDKKREREFYGAIRRKEEKEIEDMQGARKLKEGG